MLLQKEGIRREEQTGRKKVLFIALNWEDGKLRGAKPHESKLEGLWLMLSTDAILQEGQQVRQVGVLASRRL